MTITIFSSQTSRFTIAKSYAQNLHTSLYISCATESQATVYLRFQSKGNNSYPSRDCVKTFRSVWLKLSRIIANCKDTNRMNYAPLPAEKNSMECQPCHSWVNSYLDRKNKSTSLWNDTHARYVTIWCARIINKTMCSEQTCASCQEV